MLMARYADTGSTPSAAFGLVSGQWYASSQQAISAQNNLGNGTLRLYPKFWPASTIVGVQIDVSGAGNTGATFRAGIYADSGGQPGALLYEFGSLAADTTTPTALTGTWKIPYYGVWWFGGAVQNAATTQPTIQGITSSDSGIPVPVSLNAAPSAGTGPRCVFTATASGALPATAAGSAVAGIAPRLLLKVK